MMTGSVDPARLAARVVQAASRLSWTWPALFVLVLHGTSAIHAAPVCGPPSTEANEADANEADAREAGAREADAAANLAQQVTAVLQARCADCHGRVEPEAGLNLSDEHGLIQGGDSGSLLAGGDSQQGLMFELVNERRMPPPDDSEPLPDAERELLLKWLKSGAPLPSGQSLREIERTSVTEVDVVPILLRRCTMCHGADYQLGQLDLRTRSALLKGGKSGPAALARDAAGSRMVQQIRDQQCPPKDELSRAAIEPMTAQELTTLMGWIDAGLPVARESNELVAAVDPGHAESAERVTGDQAVADEPHWAFQKPRRAAVPVVESTSRIHGPIDAYVLQALRARQLEFAPAADRLTLLRRVTLDLTGLPPTPDEIRRFMADERPGSYERLVDQLLASPRYGERWGRFWLDLAGYADSEGKRHADKIRPWAWRYRDYVIRSFNSNLPYDRFLVQQLAGDELVQYDDPLNADEETIEHLVATGFLRMAPDGTSANPVNRYPDRIEVIADELDVLARGVMGLTMNCARCHSHKYDPISQREYYAYMAVFRGAYDEYNWMVPQPFTNQWKRALPRYLTVVTAEQRAENEAANAALKSQLEQLEQQLQADDLEPAKRTQLEKQKAQLKNKLVPLPQIRALWDRGQPSPMYVYRRGDENQPAVPVSPGVLSVLTGPDLEYDVTAVAQDARSTYRRLAFANWLVDPDHPLTARVITNRIWKHHFGFGLVRSLDNFGRLGTPPTHPELLDWLALRLIDSGWDVKSLHRAMVTSQTYRQSSFASQDALQRDPDNRWLSRMPMRRLSAEEVRDAILFVSGRLNERPYGPPDAVQVRKDGLVTSQPVQNRWRRSVYVRHRRKEMPSILETFDLPQMNPNCVQRTISTVVSQPLYLLNSAMIHSLSRDFARRIHTQAGSDQAEQIRLATLAIWGRSPTPLELETGLAALEQLRSEWVQRAAHQSPPPADENSDATPDADSDGESSLAARDADFSAFADYCHVLINSAAFLYVD